MADPVTRSAARWAAAIALPVALIAGFVFFRVFTGAAHPEPSRSPTPQSTGPVAMAAPPLTEQAATICRAVLSQVPASLRDRHRRPVTAGAEQNAAYGDPPITLACGSAPASYPPDADVFNLSGVCWYPAHAASATVWTTVDRTVPVAVTVPNSYDGQPQWVIEFSPAVGADPSRPPAPSGCYGGSPTPS